MEAKFRNLAVAIVAMVATNFRCQAHQPLRGRSMKDELAARIPSDSMKDQSESCLTPRSSIDQIAVFGDSFSDVGNIFRASNQTEPPPALYYRGRYSNGRNYVDFLGHYLNLSISTSNVYAWGGATTSNEVAPSFSTFLNERVPSVADQVQSYLERGKDSEEKRDGSSAALYIVLAGYNDYWWYANDENRTLPVTGMVDLVLSSLRESARRLARRMDANKLPSKKDMKRDVILVGNLPPMAMMPDAKTKSPDVVRIYEEVTQTHNFRLAGELDSFLDDSTHYANVRLFPVHEALSQLVENTCLGFASISSACYSDNDSGNDEGCEDPFSHIFLDSWHPMTWTHQALARAALAGFNTQPKMR